MAYALFVCCLETRRTHNRVLVLKLTFGLGVGGTGSADTHLPGSLQGKGEPESMFISHTFQNRALSFEVSDDSLV